MNEIPRLASVPEWKQFLRLGERLLNQPTASAQCTTIEETIRGLLGARAKLWLAEPFYPLPGEQDLETLPSTHAPDCVNQALESREIIFSNPETGEKEKRQTARCAALPLISHENLLGILEVERPNGPEFRPEELNFLEGLAANSALALQVARQAAIKNWRSDQLGLVRQVSAQIANVLDLDDLSQHVTDLIQRTFDYYYVAIFTTNSDKDTLRFRASASVRQASEIQQGFLVHFGEGIVGTVAKTGQEIVSTNVKQEPRYRFVDALPETESEVALPLKIKDRVLGVLDVQSDELAAFHENDLVVLRALADSIALAVEDARLYSGLRRRADQISAVFEVTSKLTSILDLDPLLDEVVSVIQKRFGYPYVHIYTVHPGRRMILYAAGSGARSANFERNQVSYSLDNPQGMIPWVARNGKMLLANNVDQEPLFLPTDLPPAETRSELDVPLVYGNEVFGVLDLQSDQLNAFDEDDVFLIEALAGSIAIAMRNANLYRSEQWRRQVADSFRDVAGLVSANVATNELLDIIIQKLAKNLPCESAAIWLVDEYAPSGGEPQLRLAAVSGVSEAQIEATLQDSQDAQNWVQRALTSEQTTIRQPEDPYGPLGLALNYPSNYSSIAAPLRAGDHSLGLLTLAHSTAGRYGSEARAMTTTFASYAAVAIQNARLFRSAQEQAYISTVLLQVAEASQASNTVEELFDTLARLTPLLVGVHKCAFYLWEDSEQAFLMKAWYGLDLHRENLAFLENEVPALAQLRATGQTIFIGDPVEELHLPAASVSAETGTLVLLPLIARGEILGAFLVAHEIFEPASQKAFDEQNLLILQGIAHQAAITVENIRLLDARQEEAYVTAVLLQVAQAVVSQNELDDILDTIIHLMMILVGVETSAIYLWNRDAQKFVMAKSTARAEPDSSDLVRLYDPGEFPLLDTVYERDAMVICPLASGDISPRWWPQLTCLEPGQTFKDLTTAGTDFIVGFPLSVKGEVFGVLLAKETNIAAGLRERRMEIVNGIAQQVSLAIQNERLNVEMVERERLEREVQLARQIQKTFLPNQIPQPQNWQVNVRWQTARQVGGDFYDVFKLHKGRLALVIADVADKGMAAALYMTVTRTLIRAVSENMDSPARVLERVNHLLAVESPDSLFVTTVYLVLNPETGELIYTNAGHNRPLILRQASGDVEQLPLGGTAMGVVNDLSYKDLRLQLNPGDTLLMFTDGVTETFSPEDEPFGDDRLRQVIQDWQKRNESTDLLGEIETALQNFRSGLPPSDDMTLVELHRNTAEGEEGK